WERVPGAVLAADIVVTAAAVTTLPWTVGGHAYAGVAVPDFEPLTVSAAVSVALVSGSVRATAAGCLTLAAAYGMAQLPAQARGDLASTLNVIGWQVVTATCCCVFIRRLRAVAGAVEVATGRAIAARG